MRLSDNADAALLYILQANVEYLRRSAAERTKSNRTISSIIQPALLLHPIHSEVSIKGAVAFLSPPCTTTPEGGRERKREREREGKKRAVHNLVCLTDKGSEYRHLSALFFSSPNRFSDVSICQGPNENMMRRICGPRGRKGGMERGMAAEGG